MNLMSHLQTLSNHEFFLNRWAIHGLFFFILVVSFVQLVDKILLMSEIEPRISGVGNNSSTN